MSAHRVLRVRRSDINGREEVVLLHVQSRGPKLLDLAILGTEGANPYAVSVKHDKIESLQASDFKGTTDGWRAVLSWAFLAHPPEVKYMDLIKGVEVVAAVLKEEQIKVFLRQNISGITHLGTLTLVRDDDREIELFDWTSLSVQQTNATEQRIDDLQKELQVQNATIARMRAQMDDFLKAKEEHEHLMLERFAHLLNAKKLKIRDQQRLLVGAKIDENAVSQVPRGSKGITSRKGTKRKANESEEESDGEFETAHPGARREEPGADEEFPGGGSPYRSEDTDEGEDLATTKGGDIVQSEARSATMEIPQARQLPFHLKQSTAPAQAGDGEDVDADDADTDDEL